jgi:hypothetical protein
MVPEIPISAVTEERFDNNKKIGVGFYNLFLK